jgi:serine/threonine protein phosphatase PrpC
VFIIG